MLEKLKEILKETAPELEDMPITREASLREDLGLDSLSLMMMSLSIEEAFGFTFDNEISSLVTVGDVCDYIERKTA